MGGGPSIRKYLDCQSSQERCYSVNRYVPFPKHKWPSGLHGLVTDIHVFPEKLRKTHKHIERAQDDNTWYWWCDAQFLPFNDSYMFATAGAFHPRDMRTWVSQPSIPNGRILLYNIEDPDDMKCNIFARTTSTVFPRVHPHPLGQQVAFCGTGQVALLSAQGEELYQKSRDMTNAVHSYCALSSNGVHMACIKRGMGVFFLETYTLDFNFFMNDSVRLHKLVPGFVPSRVRNDHTVCRFSPCWKYIAVSGQGNLFLVGRRDMDLICNICPEILNGLASLPHAQAFDFDPVLKNKSEIITLATNDQIMKINFATKETLCSVETKEVVDCIVYSRDGKTLAVGYHNFDICILDRDELEIIHKIPMSEMCKEQYQRVYAYYPSVTSLSFSQNGEHLASTSCDGRLRLWRIPKLFSLQELARDAFLTSIPIRQVKKLKLPKKIKNFLLYND